MRDQKETSIAAALIQWFEHAARPLPWRDPSASAWHILVSEFMLQQTQVDRVLPRYEQWIAHWPTPADLAAAPPSDALRAWDRLGYPRRALWLHRAATEIATKHHNQVPRAIETLESLTGVGPYTARAVAVFAYGDRHPVVDTNTRRVIARLVHGLAAAASPAAADLSDMEALLPAERAEAQTTNAAAMELGALVCTARAPLCAACPVAQWCEWRGTGYPDNAPQKRATQAKFAGSDRQVRGRIMAALRAADGPLTHAAAIAAARNHSVGKPKLASADTESTLAAQAERALLSLVKDGLAVASGDGYSLPTT